IGLKLASTLAGWAAGFWKLVSAIAASSAAAGVGKGGLLGLLLRLKGIGPLAIGITLAYTITRRGGDWLNSLPGANFVNTYLGGNWLSSHLGLPSEGGSGSPQLTGTTGGAGLSQSAIAAAR